MSWIDRFGDLHGYWDDSQVDVADANAPVVTFRGDRDPVVLVGDSSGKVVSQQVSFTYLDSSPVTSRWELSNAAGDKVRSEDGSDGCSDYFSNPYARNCYQIIDGLDANGVQLPDGEYTLTEFVTDSGGRTGSMEVRVVIDTRIPAVLTAPLAGSSVSGVVDVTLTANPGYDVSNVSVGLADCSGSGVSASEDGSSWVAKVDVSRCTPGEQRLVWTVYWRGPYGEMVSSGSTPVTVVNTTPPVVTGTVTTAAGAALPGAVVTVYDAGSGQPVRSVRSGADGGYRVEGLNAGQVKVRAWAAGYLTQFGVGKASLDAADAIPLVGGQVLERDFALTGEAVVAGTVTAAGAPVPGAVVWVYDAGSGQPVRSVRSGADGGYRVPGLVAGQVKVRVSAAGYLTQFGDGKASLDAADVYPLAAGEVLGRDFALR